MAKFQNKDEAVEAYKKGQIDFWPLCKILKDLGKELPTLAEVHEWDQERESHLESRREANQLPVVLALALVVALLFGAIAWIISYVIFDKGDTTSLLLASQVGQFTFTVGIIIAIVLAAERRTSA